MRLLRRSDDHVWSQRHLSHYVEGDLGRRARRRLELHAEECPDCSRGIRALRALLKLVRAPTGQAFAPAPAGIFDLVRADAVGLLNRANQADGA
jgi:putative zinc finger protein